MKKTNNAPQLNIRYVSSDGQVLIVPLGGRDLTIGSAENADIRLNSTTISRQHLRIALRDNHVYVTDLDSRNGSFLNGLRLQPNVEHEWLSSDRLRLSETTLELVEQVLQEKKVLNDLKLTAEPMLVKQGQMVRLTLTTIGEKQQVTLQSQSIVPGLDVQLNWQAGEVKPDSPVEIQAQIRSTKMSLTGGERRVRFVALSRSNLISTVEVTVQLRKKLETLLLLLLLLTGCSAASVVAIVVVPQIIALINPPPPQPPNQSQVLNSPAQPAIEAAVAPTTALSPVPPTKSPAPITPTIVTPTDTPVTPTIVTVTPCPNGAVLTHTVQKGENLYSISQLYDTNVDALVINNNIANPKQIYAGQQLRVKCGEHLTITVTPVTITPPVCNVKPTSPLGGLACDQNTFYWDPVPGADHYQLNIYDSNTNKIKSVTTQSDETKITTNLGSFTGLQFSWDVQALQNGQVICSSQPVTMLRSTCPPPEPQKADLVVSDIKLTANPAWSQQCTLLTVNVSYTLTNIGKGASGPFYSNLSYQSDRNGVVDLQCGGTRGFGCHESNLQPGQSVTIADQSHLSLKDVFATQQITVIGTADIGVPGEDCPNNTYCRVDESNEGNNASKPLIFPVPNCFDLGVKIIDDVSQDCVDPANGQFKVSYAYTVTNYGSTPVDAITVTETRGLTFTLTSVDPITIPDDKVTQTIKTLAGGNTSTTLSGEFIVKAPNIGDGESNFSSDFTLTVAVQAQGIQDSDTTNNTDQLDTTASGGEGGFDCRPNLDGVDRTAEPVPPVAQLN